MRINTKIEQSSINFIAKHFYTLSIPITHNKINILKYKI